MIMEQLNNPSISIWPVASFMRLKEEDGFFEVLATWY